jgi:hypothetical protein
MKIGGDFAGIAGSCRGQWFVELKHVGNRSESFSRFGAKGDFAGAKALVYLVALRHD